MPGGNFQYQVLAEPTTVPSGTVAPSLDKWLGYAEPPPRPPQRTAQMTPPAIDPKLLTLHQRIDLDKWYVRPPDPPRPVQRLAPALGWYTIDAKLLTQKETVRLDNWYVEHLPPPRQLSRLTDRECLDYVSVYVMVDGWQHFYPDYLRPTPRLTDRDCLDFGEGVFTVERPQLDKWLGYQEPPPRQLRRELYGEGWVAYAAAEIALLSKWYVQHPSAPRQLWREATFHGDYAATGLGVFAAASVPPDRWWPHVEEVLRPRFRAYYGDSALVGQGVFVKQVVDLDMWLGYQEPQPRPTRRELYGEGWFTLQLSAWAESVTVDRWWQQDYVPPRPPRRLTLPELRPEPVFVAPPPVLPDMWQPHAEEVLRARWRAYYGDSALQLAAFAEAAGLDKWWQEPAWVARGPQRLAVGDSELQLASFLPPAPPLSGWWQEPADVVRPRRREGSFHGDFAVSVGVFGGETVTVDKWFGWPADLIRGPLRMPAGGRTWTDVSASVLPAVLVAGLWTEAFRPLVWVESPRPLVWTGPRVQQLTKRLDEGGNTLYAYDFLNDAVIGQGDPIASVLAVNVTTRTAGATPLTTGAPNLVGTQVQLTVAGGQENVTYQFEFKVQTVAGAIRVGLGKLLVQDDY